MYGGQKITNCNKKEPMVGIEPTARDLQGRRSTAELHRLTTRMPLEDWVGISDANNYTLTVAKCQACF